MFIMTSLRGAAPAERARHDLRAITPGGDGRRRGPRSVFCVVSDGYYYYYYQLTR